MVNRHSPKIRTSILVVAFALSALIATTVQAQSYPSTGFDTEEYLEPADRSTKPPPQLQFNKIRELALPGPLSATGPRLRGEQVAIPVPGGIAIADWNEDLAPVLEPATQAPTPPVVDEGRWSEFDDGRRRYGSADDRHLWAQKRCTRCKAGWKKKWRLRVGARVASAPVVTERAIFFGALDNRVYRLKRRNGHRIWATDISDRVTGPLALMQLKTDSPSSSGGPDHSVQVILLLTGSGQEIVALDAERGSKLASFSIPEDSGRLIGRPLTTPDGKIVVAQQRYKKEQAALLVLELIARPPKGEPAEGGAQLDSRTTTSSCPDRTSSRSPQRISTISAVESAVAPS